MTSGSAGDSGPRFAFGANWNRFLSTVDETRIAEAQGSLREMLDVGDLQSVSFLDIGSGSGLFSLAARRLGARVTSFDFDADSVECTEALKSRYFPGDASWRIERGSVLDSEYMRSLATFDVVYSWGVLHHTGAMWSALQNAMDRVGTDGKLFIAIYNDQGWKSRIWWRIKSTYNRLPSSLRGPFVTLINGLAAVGVAARGAARLRLIAAISPFFSDRRERGMSAKYDMVDWVGGFPYEFANFEILKDHVEAHGFDLVNAKRTTSWGCNEFVFRRRPVAPHS